MLNPIKSVDKWFDGGYKDAVKDYNKKVDENTGVAGQAKASALGQSAANTIGQTSGEMAASNATNAGLTKGQGAAIGQSVANNSAIQNVNTETAKAAKANQEEVNVAAQKAAETNEKRQEHQQIASGIGDVIQGGLVGGATMAGGPMGGLAANLATSAGRGLLTSGGLAANSGTLQGISTLISDERAKYKSRILNGRLLHE